MNANEIKVFRSAVKALMAEFERYVEVSEDTVLKDMQEMLVEMKAQARINFRKAVMDAKRNGLGVEELHELVNAPLGT